MVHETTYWRNNTASSSFTSPVQKGGRESEGEEEESDLIITGFLTMHTHKEAILRFFHTPLILFSSFMINCLMVLSQFTAIFKYYRQATQHVSVCQKRSEKHKQCNAKAIHVLLPAHRPWIPQTHSIVKKLTPPNLYLINCFLI